MAGDPTQPSPGVDVDGIIARAKAILIKPKEEWPKIEAEQTTTGDIFRKYALPLAAIGPVAAFIGGQVFGYGAFGITIRPSLTAGISTLIVTYVMSLVSLFVVTFIANFFAAKFGGQENNLNAFKLVAYSMTASWLAGIFGIVPSLAMLGIVGLYSFYLFYVGASPLMKVPADKTGSYTAATVVGAIVVMFIASLIVGAVSGAFVTANTFASADDEMSGTVSVPGMGSIDLDKMKQATDQMQKAANGETKAVETTRMQALLPASIGAFKRTATESAAMGAMGSQAQATYESGSQRFNLSITDTQALAGLAGMAAAMGVESSREDASGYEKIHKVGGQMVTEKWQNSGSGTFGVLVNNRFMVQAEGSAGSINDLKAAVATIDQVTLAALAG